MQSSKFATMGSTIPSILPAEKYNLYQSVPVLSALHKDPDRIGRRNRIVECSKEITTANLDEVRNRHPD